MPPERALGGRHEDCRPAAPGAEVPPHRRGPADPDPLGLRWLVAKGYLHLSVHEAPAARPEESQADEACEEWAEVEGRGEAGAVGVEEDEGEVPR